jgi:phosphatidylglycerophosphate synthase
VLRSIVHARGQTLPASPLGKVKMFAQVVAILVLILGQGHTQQFFVVGQVALWVATIAALVSAFEYWRHYNALLPPALSPGAPLAPQLSPAAPRQTPAADPAEARRGRVSA